MNNHVIVGYSQFFERKKINKTKIGSIGPRGFQTLCISSLVAIQVAVHHPLRGSSSLGARSSGGKNTATGVDGSIGGVLGGNGWRT